MLLLKSSAIPFLLKPETVLMIQVVHSVYDKYGKDCTITSMNDGVHSKSSLHYHGGAVDFRIKNILRPGGREDDPLSWDWTMINKIFRECKAALPLPFQLILEKDHIHGEVDWKNFPRQGGMLNG